MGNADIRNLGCPECGGILRRVEGFRSAECSFCNGKFFVDWPMESRYVLHQTLDKRQAGELLRKSIKQYLPSLRKKDGLLLDTQFVGHAKPARYQLYFVPFFRYSGLKVGTSPTKKEDMIRETTEFGNASMGEPPIRSQVEVRYKIESKVILAEVGMVLPALHLSGDKSRQWGLDALLKEDDFFLGENFRCQPFDREELEERGTVLTPFRSPAEALEMCRNLYKSKRKKTRKELERSKIGLERKTGYENFGGRGSRHGRFSVGESFIMDHDEIEYRADIIGDGISMFYCPVWKIELFFRNKIYEAYIDAGRGRVLSVEVPVAGRPKPWSLYWKSLVIGQVFGVCWYAVGAIEEISHLLVLYGALSMFFLGALYLIYQDLSALDFGPLPAMKVIYHENFSSEM